MADDKVYPKYDFEFFKPLDNPTGKSIAPNFTGVVDPFNPKKNLAHFEEVAANAGLNALKGAIIKNTFQFFEKDKTVKNQAPQFKNADPNTMPVLGFSVFGFPIFSNLIIKGDSYNDNNGNVIGQFNDIRLDAVIMEMNNDNNLVTTDIQGRNGTIIEYISSKSWSVQCTGTILAKTPGVYPQEDVTNLIIALNSNKALRITSWFLNMAGIYNIVIKRKVINQEVGSQEYQKFEFEALADRPVLLKLKQ